MKSKIKYALAVFLFGISNQLWAACVVQGDSSIIATANGDSCTNSSAISTSANDAFGMDAGSLTFISLSNAASGTITTTGNGAAGIHTTGDNAIIINDGTIAVSGGSNSGNFADGINALGNNSQVTNNGTITASGTAMFGVWFDNSTGGSFNNTGSILATDVGGVGVALGNTTETFANSGVIVSNQGYGVLARAVESFTNTGEITAAPSSYGVFAVGTIATLNNAQGGNGASGSTTALTYTGNLPTNYNIIINSPTHYGQLAGTGLGGAASTFGIYAGSVLSKGSYTSVLSGFATSNLAGTTSGNYNGFTWSLSNSSGDIWDLIVNGASTADTQQSLVNTAASLQNTYTLQNSVLANSFTYDCNVFGANNVCVSAGGRNTQVSAANGLNNASALLIAAYRVMPSVRVGAYADQNLSVNNAGSTVNLGNNTPLIGLFGVWNERLDGTGTEVKVSAAYGQKNTTVTRQVVGTSEAGSGSSQLNSQGAQLIAKYGFGVTPDVIVSPYVGMRYTQNNMGGYTEGASSTVTAPLTYSSLNTNSTTALAGIGAQYKFIPQATVFASAGVETDTNTSNGTYSATGITGLTPINFNANPVRTRPTATLGATYDVEKNQRIGLTGIYRQEPYQAVSTTTVMATYTIGL
ncbi:autotransporter outer membrane beta-barrel domain-containing protein [Polynucleobacter sp. es-EL-1]|uniref:beta strand repeat-containing protein n=1 Tax=Polynucleobacter sp. es-EL-1 TaxID=1855652 RepID=UPI001BFED77B|nr:autotransporter outer membrane beta-barrel domain-containing protein [Polynucleobacter sp. es-EL-1]QWE09953.1 autotransporter domain-containing protein [Polynucleobacter sp. es-EL-1]